jgi:hypothetical protein
MTFAYIYQWGNNPVDLSGFIIFMILFGGILSVFYGMTIIVTDKHLLIKLGVGFYAKKIELSEIRSVTEREYPFYCGYGIRIVSNGMLYNVSGRHAVEIKFKRKKDVILIGTSDWKNLKTAIESELI